MTGEKALVAVVAALISLIAVLVVPGGTISVSAVKPNGGAREVTSTAVEPAKAQPATQE